MIRALAAAILVLSCSCAEVGGEYVLAGDYEMAAHNVYVDKVKIVEALAGCWVGQVRAVGARQSIGSGSPPTVVQFDSEDFDHGACWDSTTNYEYTVKVPGVYSVAAQVGLLTNTPGTTIVLYIELDTGSGYAAAVQYTSDAGAAQYARAMIPAILLSEGDKIRARIEHDEGSTVSINGLKAITYIAIQQITK